jgi:hypothetical protein
MKIVRNFNDFVKNRINEDVDPIENPTAETPELEAGIDATEEMESEDQSNLIDEPEENWEEEESGEYEGATKLKQLAEALGAELTNNEINYDGHKINWFSETEAFHVDRKKFETVEEVIDYLQGDHGHEHAKVDNPEMELEPAMESRRFRRNKK